MAYNNCLVTRWGLSITLSLPLLIVACDGRTPEANAPLTSEPLTSESPKAGNAPNLPGPPPPPEGAFLAQLPPEQTSQLISLGVDVVVPGAVPPGFSVTDIRTQQAADGGTGGSSYIVVYQDSTDQCFAIEFAADGIGDPSATENRLPIEPPLFDTPGYGLNYGPFQDDSMREQFPDSNLYSDWLLGPAGAYRLVGAAYIKSLFPELANCQDIAPQEAVSVVESLTVLSPQKVGDGLL